MAAVLGSGVAAGRELGAGGGRRLSLPAVISRPGAGHWARNAADTSSLATRELRDIVLYCLYV